METIPLTRGIVATTFGLALTATAHQSFATEQQAEAPATKQLLVYVPAPTKRTCVAKKSPR